LLLIYFLLFYNFFISNIAFFYELCNIAFFYKLCIKNLINFRIFEFAVLKLLYNFMKLILYFFS